MRDAFSSVSEVLSQLTVATLAPASVPRQSLAPNFLMATYTVPGDIIADRIVRGRYCSRSCPSCMQAVCHTHFVYARRPG